MKSSFILRSSSLQLLNNALIENNVTSMQHALEQQLAPPSSSSSSSSSIDDEKEHGKYACLNCRDTSFNKSRRSCNSCQSQLKRFCGSCHKYYTASNFSKHSNICYKPSPIQQQQQQTIVLPSINELYTNTNGIVGTIHGRKRSREEFENSYPVVDMMFQMGDHQSFIPIQQQQQQFQYNDEPQAKVPKIENQLLLSLEQRNLYQKKTNMNQVIKRWEEYMLIYKILESNSNTSEITQGDVYFCPNCCKKLHTRDAVCSVCNLRPKKLCKVCKVPFSDSAYSKHRKDCAVVQSLLQQHPTFELTEIWKTFLQSRNKSETEKKLSENTKPVVNNHAIYALDIDANVITLGGYKAQTLYISSPDFCVNRDHVIVRMIHTADQAFSVQSTVATIFRDERDVTRNTICLVIYTLFEVTGDYAVSILSKESQQSIPIHTSSTSSLTQIDQQQYLKCTVIKNSSSI
jgi:hypothetical protein